VLNGANWPALMIDRAREVCPGRRDA